jgi:hypothetical protein
LYQIIGSKKIGNVAFFVRSEEEHHCPVCEEELQGIGSRRRKGRKATGEQVTYGIRRLRCVGCRRIHHELPDLLVPYKHYEAAVLESVATPGAMLDVAADESTLYRWRLWFAQMAAYWIGGLQAIAHRFKLPVEGSSGLPTSSLLGIGHFVGKGPGWMGRLVRPLVHAQLWVHTRFAFLSARP